MKPETPNAQHLTEILEGLLSLPEETPEEIAERERHEKNAERDFKINLALGTKTGWPEKYRQAVQVPPIGDKWLHALDQAKECVQKKGIVVLYGARGSGKTRMAAELSAMVGSSQYRTAMRFFLDLRGTYRKGSDRTEMQIIDELAKTRLLVLDEIQERGETGFEDRMLTHLIDARYSAMKPTVLIANLAKGNLAESLGKSIVDRQRENGISIEFNWPSFRG